MKTIFVIGSALWLFAAWGNSFNGAWLLGVGLVAFAAVRLATREQ